VEAGNKTPRKKENAISVKERPSSKSAITPLKTMLTIAAGTIVPE